MFIIKHISFCIEHIIFCKEHAIFNIKNFEFQAVHFHSPLRCTEGRTTLRPQIELLVDVRNDGIPESLGVESHGHHQAILGTLPCIPVLPWGALVREEPASYAAVDALDEQIYSTAVAAGQGIEGVDDCKEI